jgi:hypothetical protein
LYGYADVDLIWWQPNRWCNSSGVDHGFEPKTIKLAFAASLLSKQYYGFKTKTCWFGIKIMCPSGTTCLPADCCFSELALSKDPTKHVGLVQSGHHHLTII